jgi:hypothetical protein
MRVQVGRTMGTQLCASHWGACGFLLVLIQGIEEIGMQDMERKSLGMIMGTIWVSGLKLAACHLQASDDDLLYIELLFAEWAVAILPFIIVNGTTTSHQGVLLTLCHFHLLCV